MSNSVDAFMSDGTLARYMELVAKYPGGRKPILTDPFNPEKAKCLCGHYRLVDSFPLEKTRAVAYPSRVCAPCVRDWAPFARIVCLNCRDLVGVMSPGKERTGFVWERGKHYHVERCAVCTPGLQAAPVLEKILFYRVNNIPYDAVESKPPATV